MSDIVDWGRKHRAKRDQKRDEKAQRRSSSTGVRPSMKPVPESQGQLAPLDLSSDLIVVSVACWRTPGPMLERAVRSVLDGEHQHVRVVVISDGEDTPSWGGLSSKSTGDPRLVLVRSPRNAGPYFNHDIVLRAAAKIGAPLFAVQDSDDESHPTRFVRLLQTMHASRCESVHAHLSQVEQGGVRHFVTGSAASGEVWQHRANHFGLYSTGTLMALGGYHAGFRVGYDTNLTSFLNLLTRTQMAPGALYTRHCRNNSLTRSPATGHGSALRKAHRATLRAMWEGAVRKARTSRAEAVKYIRETAIRRSHATGLSAIRNALVEEVVAKLSVVIDEVPPVHPALLQRALDGVHGMSTWAITRQLAVWIARTCEARKPQSILELGSGMSTVALAIYAARHGTRVVSLEHDKSWLDAISTKLERMGLRQHVELIHAPLDKTPDGPWYRVDLGSVLMEGIIRGEQSKPMFDMVLVDGPPADVGGRGAVMNAIRPRLAPGAMVLVHDALRDEERAQLERWRAHAVLTEVRTGEDARGLGVLVLP